MDIRPHPYWVRSDVHGLSHGLKSVHRTLFTPVCGLVPPFQVLRSYQKKPSANALGFFWQGHKDLNPEPTVLETRLINQPLGGLLLKCNFQQSKSKSPPHSQKPIKNETNWEFQKQAYGLLGLRSNLPKPSAQKLYHIPLILAIIRWLFLASFDSNYSQSL